MIFYFTLFFPDAIATALVSALERPVPPHVFTALSYMTVPAVIGVTERSKFLHNKVPAGEVCNFRMSTHKSSYLFIIGIGLKACLCLSKSLL